MTAARSGRASRRARRLLVAITAVLVAITATACGARLTHSDRQDLANAALHPAVGGVGPGGVVQTTAGSEPGVGVTSNPGGGQVNPSTGSNPGATNPAVTGSQGSQPGRKSGNGHSGSGPPSGGTSTGPSTGTTTTAATGVSCPTSGTDVGLTSSTISLGTIADLTGPVSGLFEGAVQGVESWANYINNSGGLCGHSVHFDIADGQTNCTTNENDAQSLIAKDFALVGSFTLYDDCSAMIIKQHPTVSDLHTGLNPSAIAIPNHFDIAAGTAGALTGPFAFWAHEFPTQVKHVGTIAEDVPSALAEQANFVHAAQSVGWDFVYTNNASPTASSFTSEFQTMCLRDHVQMVYIETEPIQSVATMLENESTAGCRNLINIIPVAYDQGLQPDYQGNFASLKIYGYQEFPLFFNTDEANNIPALKTFQEWFARTFPGQKVSLYALYGWVYGQMFAQAFEDAGTTINRVTLIAALRRLKTFTADGLLPPTDPSTKTSGQHCYILWELSNGAFSRYDDPTTGYRCDGKFLVR